MDSLPWIRKYNPKSVKDLEGLDDSLTSIKKFISSFKKGKGLMLYGPTGSGKTSAVYAVANELGCELLEVNASDTRNAEGIDTIIGSASKQASLFFSTKIILVDEIDGLSGKQDRGGVSALVKVIEESRFPVILACTDPYIEKLSPLRKKCALIEFKVRSPDTISGFLKKICEKENIKFELEALTAIARRSGGDLRAAINDLQSATLGGKLAKQDVEHSGDRERTEDIVSSLVRVFKTTDASVAKGAYDLVNEDLEKIFLWVDENLPKEYLKPEDLARGFDALSAADVFKGRILIWQHYRFYVYCYDLLSAGIAIAKTEKYKQMVDYKPTSRILKLWIANQKNLKKKAIAEKVAQKTHVSKKVALQQVLPYLQVISRNKTEAQKIAEFLDLDGEQQEWLVR